jgi:hypothetical protein
MSESANLNKLEWFTCIPQNITASVPLKLGIHEYYLSKLSFGIDRARNQNKERAGGTGQRQGKSRGTGQRQGKRDRRRGKEKRQSGTGKEKGLVSPILTTRLIAKLLTYKDIAILPPAKTVFAWLGNISNY